jgi:hypothetical protein
MAAVAMTGHPVVPDDCLFVAEAGSLATPVNRSTDLAAIFPCRPEAELQAVEFDGRGRVKTQKYWVFGCRFTLPELLPSQYGAI